MGAAHLSPGDRVRIRRPRELDGIIGLVLRHADGGVEVQFVGDGTPYSLVVHPRHLDLLAAAPAQQVPVLAEAPAPAPARHGGVPRRVSPR